MTKTRKKLNEVEAQLVKLAEDERQVQIDHGAVHDRLNALREQLTQAFADGEIGTDGSPANDTVAKLHADLAAAEAELQSSKWQARIDGLVRRCRKLEGERQRIVTDGFDELVKELTEESVGARERFDSVLDQVHEVAQEWDRLRTAWLALERAAGLQRTMRLDIPAFPLDVSGDLSAMPFPRALEPEHA